MPLLQGFKFTHSKRTGLQQLVGVLERNHGKVTFAFSAEGQLYELDENDFRQRYLSLG